MPNNDDEKAWSPSPLPRKETIEKCKVFNDQQEMAEREGFEPSIRF
jgi:hypothetical protein